MFDIRSIKDRHPLYLVIENDLGPTRSGFWCCPFHDDSSPSFTITQDKEHYKCFGCGATGDVIDYVMTRDKITIHDALVRLGDGSQVITPEQSKALQEEYKARQEQVKQTRQREIDILLAQYTAEEVWEAYHRKLSDVHRAWWRNQGIPDTWQDYLELGFTPDKPYKNHSGELCHSPAYTIPYFHDRRFITMQYRLDQPANPDDRYRFEYKLGTAYYDTTPTVPLQDQVLICEGAKKAMVARIHGEGEKVTVLAVPSKSDFGGVVEYVQNTGRVWICLDPDATQRAKTLAGMIGSQTRVIEFHSKLDDAFLAGMERSQWNQIKKYAVVI